MDVALFDYDLPPELIAQEPAEPRDASRLLVLGPRAAARGRTGSSAICRSSAGGRLPGREREPRDSRRGCSAPLEPGGRPVELSDAAAGRRRAVGGAGAAGPPVPRGRARERGGGGGARARSSRRRPTACARSTVEAPWPVLELLDRHGLPPLPPYIARHDAPKPDDRERYQTVYARHDGLGRRAHRRAALHAGAARARPARSARELHFLTLHVGVGTFRPLRADRVEEHRIAAEDVEISRRDGRRGQSSAERGPARRRGRDDHDAGARVGGGRRTAASGPAAGAADLFIYPGHRFRAGRRARHELPPAALDAAGARRRVLRARALILRRLPPRRRRALPLLLVRRRDADRSERHGRPWASRVLELALRSSRAAPPRGPAGCAPRTARSRRRPSCRWRRRAR